MQTVHEADRLRAVVRAWKGQGLSVGLVPTMGNLHAGHMALLEQARARCDRVVASVFVNPTQFGPGEDFERYPRTLASDQSQLAEHACDLLFAPGVDVMYPFGPQAAVRMHVPLLTEMLEGAHRPGHFDGVTTVVARLLHLVQPDVAVFGRKDFQQLRVIERMVADLSMPVQIVPVATRREADGLALSSRNQYLTPEQRPLASNLQRTLQDMREAFHRGVERSKIEQTADKGLRDSGFDPDYVVIRRVLDLAEPAADERTGLIALVAARLGQTRLIDNLPFD